jgi:crotonobetainyl-CoA:carnitine CoA-transferase CaiB-like acyl-CoA transferase
VLVPILQERFRAQTSEEWHAELLGAGIPCGPINTIDEVFSDPQVLAREMLVQLPHPTAGTVKLAASPLKLSRTPVRDNEPPPLLGQHTEEVLKRHLGYSTGDITRLRDEGAI